MGTNFAHGLTATRPVPVEVEQKTGIGPVARLVLMIRQGLCSLQGHHTMLAFDRQRVLLRCSMCGHESAGWDIGEPKLRKRFEGDARHHRLSRRPKLVVRKTA